MLHTGVLGTVFGLVQMLPDLSESWAINAAVQVALLPTGYALLISGLIFKPLETAALRRAID